MLDRSFDVVVVGGGPAGLAAAVRAAEAGRSVAVVDDNPDLGGQIWRADRGRLTPAARRWIDRLKQGDVEILGGTTIVQADLGHVLGAVRGGEGLRLQASQLILATGAQERFLPFRGWTRPGVFGVGGLQALVKGGYDVSGQRVVVAGSGPLLLAVASFLRRRGAQVVCVAEQAPLPRLMGFGASLVRRPSKLAQWVELELSLLGVGRHFATWPVQVVGGDEGIQAVVLRSASGAERRVECDVLACGFGLVPDTRLASLLGCDLAQGCVVVNGFQVTSVPGVFCAGESTGIGGVDLARLEGEIAGLAAVGQHHEATGLLAQRDRERRQAAALERTFALRQELRTLPTDDTIVCRCEDATWSQIRDKDSLRDAKLHSRCGMGPCQGRVCGPALEFLRGFHPAAPRPPLFPLPLGLWTDLQTKRKTP